MEKILFYLEPYCFIFETEKSSLVYNTLNAAYIKTDNLVIREILSKLQDVSNGYSVELSAETLHDKEFCAWYHEIRESFSGDIVRLDSTQKKPFIFRPRLRIYNDINTIRKEKGRSLGESILRNLSEVTFYMSSECDRGCTYCNQYYKQFNHCTCFTSVDSPNLDEKDYAEILKRLEAAGLQRVNFVVGNNFASCKNFMYVWNNLSAYPFHAYIYMPYQASVDFLIPYLKERNSKLNIYIHSVAELKEILAKKDKYSDDSISCLMPVSSEKDLSVISNMETMNNLQILPFYTGDNLKFFEDYVYMSLSDLLEAPITKKSIYRRQVLNENFYGKLYIYPNGDVYANVNCSRLGNIKEHLLAELVYNEMNSEETWLQSRDAFPKCQSCVNRYLCPSISNYELVIGKTDLCKDMH